MAISRLIGPFKSREHIAKRSDCQLFETFRIFFNVLHRPWEKRIAVLIVLVCGLLVIAKIYLKHLRGIVKVSILAT